MRRAKNRERLKKALAPMKFARLVGWASQTPLRMIYSDEFLKRMRDPPPKRTYPDKDDSTYHDYGEIWNNRFEKDLKQYIADNMSDPQIRAYIDKLWEEL